MTDAEALEAVRGLMAGCAIAPPIGGDSRHPLGQDNADRLIAALNSAGWSWVYTGPSPEQWERLRATGRTVVDYHPAPTDERG